MPTRSTISRVIVSAALMALAVTGCSASSSPPPVPTADAEPARPAESSKPECQEISPSLLSALQGLVAAKGMDATLTVGAALFDEGSGFTHVVGNVDITDPAMEDVAAIWATLGDVTAEPFEGEIWATDDGGAQMYSDAPVMNEANVDPTNVPVLGCLHQAMKG